MEFNLLFNQILDKYDIDISALSFKTGYSERYIRKIRNTSSIPDFRFIDLCIRFIEPNLDEIIGLKSKFKDQKKIEDEKIFDEELYFLEFLKTKEHPNHEDYILPKFQDGQDELKDITKNYLNVFRDFLNSKPHNE